MKDWTTHNFDPDNEISHRAILPALLCIALPLLGIALLLLYVLKLYILLLIPVLSLVLFRKGINRGGNAK